MSNEQIKNSKEFNHEQPFIALAAIIVKNGKVLMVKEAHGPDKGRWSLPAGKWDHEENLIEGVKREVKEETGYDFIPDYVLGIYTVIRSLSTGARMQVLRPIFVGKITGEPASIALDIEENMWIDIEKIDEVDYRSPDIKNILKDYKDGIKYPLEILRHYKAE